jgi:hypothetical protein
MIKIDRCNEDAKPPKESDKGLFVTVFSDGSYCPRTSAWGVGIWYRYAEELPVELKYGGLHMPNPMEVERYGIEVALKHIMEHHDLTGKVIVVQCDNIHALQNVVREMTPQLKCAGAKFVKAKHVKAHTSNETSRTRVNAIVDMLAREGMEHYRRMADDGRLSDCFL